MDAPLSFDEWKQALLAQINALPHTVAQGNAFVRYVLQTAYNLSEEDAINATEYAGAGDKGVDALHIILPEEEDSQSQALVMQGKYGSAGTSLDLYSESQKFFSALKKALDGDSVTPAVDKAAAVIKNGGQVRYIVATVEPLSQAQSHHLDNVKKLAHADFDARVVVDAVNLHDLYAMLNGVQPPAVKSVQLACRVVPVDHAAYVGAASLAAMYGMLHDYAHANGSVDAIYDRNIRKYLKKRTGSVNDGIFKTLADEPARFIAYNNGITIVCSAAHHTEQGLLLDNPYIVNGCQATRTLFDFMEIRFAGVPLQDPGNKMASYKNAFMAIKVLAVGDAVANDYANNITRYSNKQNAVRGKDFIALEDMYRQLKGQLKKQAYFLETQTGEYDALSQAQKEKFPKATHVVNAFEATLAYAAGMLGKPHIAFGRSISFAPGGTEFDTTVQDLTADDLLVPWMILRQTQELGYTAIAKHNPQPGTEHRAQTRYFFLFLYFRFFRRALKTAGLGNDKASVYQALKALTADYTKTVVEARPQHPFRRLLELADEYVLTYMALAAHQNWYTDRNAFLKQTELIDEAHVLQATAVAEMKIGPIAAHLTKIVGKAAP